MRDDPDCAFCAIANGRDHEAQILCETERWLAFPPLRPATRGHTLVVPRLHVPDLWACGPELTREVMDGVQRVGRTLQEVLAPEGLNLITSAGETAEQTVFHLHLHIVPRWKGGAFGPIWPERQSDGQALSTAELAHVRRACSAA